MRNASFESDFPEAMEPFPESGVVTKALSNIRRLQLAEDAKELLPSTEDGAEAWNRIGDLIDELHRVKLDDVEHIFTQLREIFNAWNIKIENL